MISDPNCQTVPESRCMSSLDRGTPLGDNHQTETHFAQSDTCFNFVGVPKSSPPQSEQLEGGFAGVPICSPLLISFELKQLTTICRRSKKRSKENGFKLGKIAPGLWVSPSAPPQVLFQVLKCFSRPAIFDVTVFGLNWMFRLF